MILMILKLMTKEDQCAKRILFERILTDAMQLATQNLHSYDKHVH